jgi:hypothetical protein
MNTIDFAKILQDHAPQIIGGIMQKNLQPLIDSLSKSVAQYLREHRIIPISHQTPEEILSQAKRLDAKSEALITFCLAYFSRSEKAQNKLLGR